MRGSLCRQCPVYGYAQWCVSRMPYAYRLSMSGDSTLHWRSASGGPVGGERIVERVPVLGLAFNILALCAQPRKSLPYGVRLRAVRTGCKDTDTISIAIG